MKLKKIIYITLLLCFCSCTSAFAADTLSDWTRSINDNNRTVLYEAPSSVTIDDFISLWDNNTADEINNKIGANNYFLYAYVDNNNNIYYVLSFVKKDKTPYITFPYNDGNFHYCNFNNTDFVYRIKVSSDNVISHDSYAVIGSNNRILVRFFSFTPYFDDFNAVPLSFYTTGNFIFATSIDVLVGSENGEVLKKRNWLQLPNLTPVDWFNFPQLAKDAFHAIKSFIWGDEYEGVSMDDPNATDAEKASGLFYSIFKGQETTSDLIGGSLGAILQYVYEIPSSIESKIVSIFVPSQEDFNNGVNSSRDKIFEKIPIDTNLIDDWLSPVPKIPHIYYGSDVYYANT